MTWQPKSKQSKNLVTRYFMFFQTQNSNSNQLRHGEVWWNFWTQRPDMITFEIANRFSEYFWIHCGSLSDEFCLYRTGHLSFGCFFLSISQGNLNKVESDTELYMKVIDVYTDYGHMMNLSKILYSPKICPKSK